MIGKAFGGVLPEPGEFTRADKTILAAADAMIGTAREHMKTQQLHQVLNAVWAVVADANRYFASRGALGARPRPIRKRQGTILYVTAEVLRQVAILAQPFVPGSAAKLLDLLAFRPSERGFAELDGEKRISSGRHSCRRRRRCSRAMSSRKQRPENAGRQPLPPGFSRFRQPSSTPWSARARAAGIGRMVTISTRVKKHAQVLAVAEKFPDVFCSVGTHPHNAHEELDIDAKALIALAKHPKVVAIGEAGLDYHYDKSPRDAQAKSFRQHIAAARETGLPLVIHSRDCDADMARDFGRGNGEGRLPGRAALLHRRPRSGVQGHRARPLHLASPAS